MTISPNEIFENNEKEESVNDTDSYNTISELNKLLNIQCFQKGKIINNYLNNKINYRIPYPKTIYYKYMAQIS